MLYMYNGLLKGVILTTTTTIIVWLYQCFRSNVCLHNPKEILHKFPRQKKKNCDTVDWEFLHLKFSCVLFLPFGKVAENFYGV